MSTTSQIGESSYISTESESESNTSKKRRGRDQSMVMMKRNASAVGVEQSDTNANAKSNLMFKNNNNNNNMINPPTVNSTSISVKTLSNSATGLSNKLGNVACNNSPTVVVGEEVGTNTPTVAEIEEHNRRIEEHRRRLAIADEEGHRLSQFLQQHSTFSGSTDTHHHRHHYHSSSATTVVVKQIASIDELKTRKDYSLEGLEEEFSTTGAANIPGYCATYWARRVSTQKLVYARKIFPNVMRTLESSRRLNEYYQSIKLAKYFAHKSITNSTLLLNSSSSGSGSSSTSKAALSSNSNSMFSSDDGGSVSGRNKVVSGGGGGSSSHYQKLLDIFLINTASSSPDAGSLYIMTHRYPLSASLQHRLWSSPNAKLPIMVVKEWIIQLANACETLALAGVAHRYVRPENILVASADTHHHRHHHHHHQQPQHRNSLKNQQNEQYSVNSAIMLTGFDVASFRYWDSQERKHLPCPTRWLPLPLPPHLLDHLPPEAAHDNYDCSMVDVWSIGVIICLLITGTHPFDLTTLVSTKVSTTTNHNTTPNNDDEESKDLLITQWKQSTERHEIAEEIRSLLDDIFCGATNRITVGDLAHDIRLQCNSSTFYKMKWTQYYRIDIVKNINTDLANIPLSLPKPKNERIPADTFVQEAKTIFDNTGWERLFGGEDAIKRKGYHILLDRTFRDNLLQQLWSYDHYLKASIDHRGNDEDATTVGVIPPELPPPSPSPSPTTYCWAKVICTDHIPIREQHMWLNESARIARYFGGGEHVCWNLIARQHCHRVLDIFWLDERWLYVFYEELYGYRSLYHVVYYTRRSIQKINEQSTKSNSNIKSKSKLCCTSNNGGKSLSPNCPGRLPPFKSTPTTICSLEAVHCWMLQLTSVVQCFAKHGISHRYIRPEFCYVNVNQPTTGHLKLSHFDLSCFVWSPRRCKRVKRTRGLQDEFEHRWDHLPPECFQARYESLPVDVWSIGVITVFCCTYGCTPFVPDSGGSITVAQQQWYSFKQLHPLLEAQLPALTATLERIFVHADIRLQATELENELHQAQIWLLQTFQQKSPIVSKSSIVTRSTSTGSVDETRLFVLKSMQKILSRTGGKNGNSDSGKGGGGTSSSSNTKKRIGGKKGSVIELVPKSSSNYSCKSPKIKPVLGTIAGGKSQTNKPKTNKAGGGGGGGASRSIRCKLEKKSISVSHKRKPQPPPTPPGPLLPMVMATTSGGKINVSTSKISLGGGGGGVKTENSKILKSKQTNNLKGGGGSGGGGGGGSQGSLMLGTISNTKANNNNNKK